MLICLYGWHWHTINSLLLPWAFRPSSHCCHLIFQWFFFRQGVSEAHSEADCCFMWFFRCLRCLKSPVQLYWSWWPRFAHFKTAAAPRYCRTLWLWGLLRYIYSKFRAILCEPDWFVCFQDFYRFADCRNALLVSLVFNKFWSVFINFYIHSNSRQAERDPLDQIDY